MILRLTEEGQPIPNHKKLEKVIKHFESQIMTGQVDPMEKEMKSLVLCEENCE
jgi:hypothetical protein